MPVAVATSINPGWERSTHASSTVGNIEILPGRIRNEIPSIMAKTKEGQALLGQTVTKVTTTHTSTKIITTRMAVGDDTEIARIIDTKAMQVAPTLPIDLPDDDKDGGDATDGADRKVSFPQDALQSSRASTLTANPGILFSGRLLKNGFRLFKNNWHPVDMTVNKEGSLEWTNVDAKDHSHSVQLKDLPAGFVVLGKACLDIPAYLSPKLPKGLNPDLLAAIAQRTPKSKLKTYWFQAENDEDMTKFKAALVQILGPSILQLDGPAVRKIWTGQEALVAPAVEATVLPQPPIAPPRGSLAFQHPSVLASITDNETPDEEVKLRQRPDVRIVADEIVQETRRSVDTPRKKNMTAKEAFFAG